MKSNKVSDIVLFMKNELNSVYNEKEVISLIASVFEEYTSLTKADLVIYADRRINESTMIKINEAVKKLKKECPLQYITGKSYFMNLVFNVNQYTLIPRPETEEMTDIIIRDCKENNITSPAVLDIGTGSGCIAISIKKYIPDASVTAIDISKQILTVAMKNALANNTTIEFKEFDITNRLHYSNFGLYDIIVSNPPYVTEKEKTMMKKNVLQYEPHSALFVPDDDPLKYYKYIGDFAKNHLNNNGKIYVEINDTYSVEISSLFHSIGFNRVMIIKDLNNKNRFARINF